MSNDRHEKKKTKKRRATGEEVIYIFERVLEGWKTIRIYNTIKQINPPSLVDKLHVEKISTGNCKVYEFELSKERFEQYVALRQQVYAYWKKIKAEKENQN